MGIRGMVAIKKDGHRTAKKHDKRKEMGRLIVAGVTRENLAFLLFAAFQLQLSTYQ